MPHNDPQLWPILIAAGVATITAFLRNLYYGGRSFWSYVVESLLIGVLTIGTGFGLKAMGANGDWVYFVGSVLGLLGVDIIRHIGESVLKRKAESL
jgi:lambda family phage holin